MGATTQHCQHCGGCHTDTVCPRIKAIDYYENGTVKRVEYHGPPADSHTVAVTAPLELMRFGPPPTNWPRLDWDESQRRNTYPMPDTGSPQA